MTDPTPRELAVRAIEARFKHNPKDVAYIPDGLSYDRRPDPAHHEHRCSATDPVTGITIRSMWWDARTDDGDSEADLASLIRRWAEKQVPTYSSDR